MPPQAGRIQLSRTSPTPSSPDKRHLKIVNTFNLFFLISAKSVFVSSTKIIPDVNPFTAKKNVLS